MEKVVCKNSFEVTQEIEKNGANIFAQDVKII
jgi:hypothetical protein